MAKFQLLVDAEGRAILAGLEPVSAERGQAIKAAFAKWREAQPPEVLIAGETELIRVTDIELALDEAK